MGLILPLAIGAAAAPAMAWAVRGRSAQLLAPSVWHGPRTNRTIALTFDDGPSESTPAVLELLARHDAKATFFQCGANVHRLPLVSSEVLAGGHEIGNHTWSHPHLYFKSPGFIEDEVSRTQREIHTVTGRAPTLFRSPYGIRWFGLGNVQRRYGLLGVMWTSIALDWKLGAEEIGKRLRPNISNGAIFCLHDGRRTLANPDVSPMLHALALLLPHLRDNGYQLRTVSAMLKER